MTGPGPRSPESEPEVGPGPGERERGDPESVARTGRHEEGAG